MGYFEVSNGCWLRRLLLLNGFWFMARARRSLGSVPSTQSWEINLGQTVGCPRFPALFPGRD
jgi:hypothetical protein